MGSLQIFINAIVVALMAIYVYENERKMGEMSARHSQTELTGDMKVSALEKEVDKLKILVESKEEIKTIHELIKDMKQLISTKAGTDKLAEIEKQQQMVRDKQAELEKQETIRRGEQAVIEKQQTVGRDKLAEIEKQQKLGKDKLAEIEKQLTDKGVTYIRWGKTLCDGPNTETIYSGQVGGGHFTHKGASVNYICLPKDPDAAQPLKSNSNYAYLYGAEYEIFDYNQPQGIRSGIGQHDVACAACLAKSKRSTIMIPGRKTCYNGWTKEYEGILMAGYHDHPAAAEYACVDRDTEAIAGGSNDENGILFYPVKTVCGSLKCPPYKQDTDVLCVVCSK
ncbi:uncharacterized protein LOC127721455 isoform X2 [Mytilus californianus]|uniref:uncharacterized protein LOC127721455 isoform X2 n=1 Tax=Mytilus californianus TaxID=6549 RepID=UPI00224715CE|nr:uncharacterized protein LOC127721455 isoform X2 [Mytilus californianus]